MVNIQSINVVLNIETGICMHVCKMHTCRVILQKPVH